MEGVQLVGGDLARVEGGGGLREDEARDCHEKCKEKLACRWYTFNSKVRWYTFNKKVRWYTFNSKVRLVKYLAPY